MSLPFDEADDSGVLPTVIAPPLPIPACVSPQLVGEYQVLARLGRGGMGEVYKARHRRLDKLVALKLLPADSRGSRELAARFQREMRAVGALDHPNVVEAYDAGEQSGVVYLAMKLIDGVDLDRLIKVRGPLPIAEACELVRQAAVGLHYLHQRGLVHRDVKPSNLMRTPDGAVKVLDLGLARWCIDAEEGHGLTATGRGMGAPDFLAPEQIENAVAADARADLYGLGGTLFYLLTGRAPFADSKSLFAKLEAHRSLPPPDVCTLRPEVPAELAALLHRLLAKQPEVRFATAAEVAAALAPFAGELPRPVLSPVPRIGAAKTWLETLRRPRWPWFAVVIGLTVSAIVLATLLRNPSRSCDDPPLTGLTNSESASEQSERILPRKQPAEAAYIEALEVTLSRKVDNFTTAGLVGSKVYDPHLGDTVTVDARLSKQTYAFLIAFRPDGKVDLCFPETKSETPRLTDTLGHPSPTKSPGKEYGLSDGMGLQAFAVVVLSEPLPFEKWWPREGCPWKKGEDAPEGMIYRANGADRVEAWNAEGDRGPNVVVPGKTAIGQLAAWLRQIDGTERVQALGFVVGPQEKD
jgi:serine/threonine protein kinase